MLPLHGEFNSRERKSIRNANKITVRSNVEDGHADSEETCGEFTTELVLFVSRLLAVTNLV